jgi:alpha-L-rhamnosidase
VNDTALRSFGSAATDPRELVVTALVRPGANSLAIDAPYWPSRAVLATLVLRLADGRERRIHTDGTWRCRTATATQPEESWRSEPIEQGPWTDALDLGGFGEPIFSDDAGYEKVDVMVPAAYLRKPFTLVKPLRRARLYATAAGVYEMYLNGKRVGQDVLAPGWTDYHHRIHYQTYDVTDVLTRGVNVLGGILAPGWYAGRTGMGQHLWGFEKALWAELHLDYADGTHEVVATDGTWLGSSGPIRKADLLDGETYDARRERPGWAASGFAVSGWRPVEIVRPAIGLLEAQADPPIRVLMERPALAVTRASADAQIFDLGQNLVGWVRLRLSAPRGSDIQIRYGEMLNKDGTLFTDNLRTALATDHYLARGEGQETFEPRFTFHGFRYVEVRGAAQPLAPEAVTGVVVGSDLPLTGRFETSNPLLDQLQSNIVWGQRGNFLSIPTDCPQRDERMGWTGDIQVFARTATFNMDSAAFLAKFLDDLEDAQRGNGSVTDVAPTISMKGDGHYGWGDAMVFLPWTLYQVYGDTRVLERHYEAMRRWVDYRTAGARDFLNDAWSYGDWVSPPPQTPHSVLGPMHHARAARLLSQMAAVLGKTEDAAKYAELYSKIKAAFVAAHVTADGTITSDTQTAYALALRYDMLPEDFRRAAARHLVAAVERAQGHLATGFLGTAQLLPALAENGETELAYRILLNETYPSWLFTVKNGATTMWERWDGYSPENGPSNLGDMNSYNHYAFGAVGEWMYAHLAGIGMDPSQPAFRRIVIRPYLGAGLTHARGEYESMRGRIVSDWTLADGNLMLEVEVPAHSTALVFVPAASADSVTESARPAARAPGVRFLRQEGEAQLFEVASGRYRFAARVGSPAPAPGR